MSQKRRRLETGDEKQRENEDENDETATTFKHQKTSSSSASASSSASVSSSSSSSSSVSSSFSNSSLSGKVAMITGASSGIGKELAIQLAKKGVKVAIGARRLEKLKEVVELIEKEDGGDDDGGGYGRKCLAVKADVTVREDMKQFVIAAERAFGPVDILVNCAGCMYFTYMKNMHEDEWERMIDVNCKGVVNGVAAVLPSMTSRKTGHIINISSDAGRKVFDGLAVYSGTKFFVEAFSTGLRRELKGFNVKVTTIQPGDVKTELTANNTDDEAQKECGDLTGIAVLDPKHIANTLLFILQQSPHVAVNEVLIEPLQCPI